MDPGEAAFPIEIGDIPASYVTLPEGKCILKGCLVKIEVHLVPSVALESVDCFRKVRQKTVKS